MGCVRTREDGFTLVELLVTLALLVVVLTVAVPSFVNFVKNNRLTAATNNLVTSLTYARAEAIRRGKAVTVCASRTGTSCDGTDWDDGWIVFVDQGTPGAVDSGDEVLRVEGKVGPGVDISLGGMTYVRYLPTGLVDA